MSIDPNMSDERFEELKNHSHTKHDGSWWLTDCKGIPLCRVCPECIEAKKSRYNSWVFTGYTQADIDEQIEED
jgi:hypothetical protein